MPLYDPRRCCTTRPCRAHCRSPASGRPDDPGTCARSTAGGRTAFVEGWALTPIGWREMGSTRTRTPPPGAWSELWRARVCGRRQRPARQALEPRTGDRLARSRTRSSPHAPTQAVDRYLAVPGQAMAFTVGMLAHRRGSAKIPPRARPAIRPARVPCGGVSRTAVPPQCLARERRSLDRVGG